jgi:hypothetical protein
MSDNGKRQLVPAATSSLVMVLVGGWLLLGPTAQSGEPPACNELVGQEYADCLGLKVSDAEPERCNDWFTVEGKSGYCLDAVDGDTTVDAWIVGERLRGHLPTETEVRIFSLQTQIANLSSSPEDKELRAQLIEELVALQISVDGQPPSN